MISVLIGQGANINITDKTGWTALHYASLKGHLNGKTLIRSYKVQDR
jgi:ankyrin repeat protein